MGYMLNYSYPEVFEVPKHFSNRFGALNCKMILCSYLINIQLM